MYADDSTTFLGNDDTIKHARMSIKRYEDATAGALHDGKSIVRLMGKKRQSQPTNTQLGVNFRRMTDGEREVYLGDMIGKAVTEDERYGEILEKIEETGHRWNKERIGIYGQAIVSNTLLLSKISHRATVNTLNEQTRKKVKEKFRAFIWKGEERRGKVRWEVLMMKQEEGGVGLRDPLCAMDADKIRMFVSMMTKNRQPWMKWIERKLRRVARKWGVREAMGAKPTKSQLRDLKEDCLTENTLKIWFEIGGRGGGSRREERKVKEKVQCIELSGFGIEDEEGKWTPIERMTTKLAYRNLIQKRMKMKNYTPKKAHRNIQSIQKMMTAVERDFWWRLTHRVIQTKKTEKHWKRDRNGELVTSTCPVCKEEEESWKHYDYECKGVQEMNKRVAERMKRDELFSRDEWSLEKEGMEREEMLNIAKARWIYHCERCKMDMKQRNRFTIETLMNRLNRRMQIIKEAELQA